MTRSIACALVALVAVAGSPPAAAQSGVRTMEFGKRLNPSPGGKLVGFADLHTHPVNHISFGGRLFHGAPDVGIWMPEDMRDCNLPAGPARTREEALSDCGGFHIRGCGLNLWQALGVLVFESQNEAQTAHGKPARPGDKSSWPAHDDLTHQQMWIDWIERAYRGGLRVMVALVTNNRMLGDALTSDPADDETVLARAIPELVKLASRHPWMEIARSAADVRRIVGSDRMAVILGAELDDIGGMVTSARAGRRATDDAVRGHVRRLHGLGIRYMFPVHVVDNLFAGTAVYRDPFALANRYLTGYWWSLRCAQGYAFAHQDPSSSSKLAAGIGLAMDMAEGPTVPSCARDHGHVNKRGLTRRGKVAIDEMMRLGMFVDIDHMSHAAIDDTIALARAFHGGYPLMSGHSSLVDRSDARDDPAPEDQRHGYARREDKKLARHYRAIRDLGGVAGVEWDTTSRTGDAARWVAEVGRVMTYAGTAVAFGTDINGMVAQPSKPRCDPRSKCRLVAYSADFPRSRLGTREWDYNREGMAHYGMIADFLADVEQIGEVDVRPALGVRGDAAVPRAPGARDRLRGGDVIDALFGGAEAVAGSWERAEARAIAARRTRPAPLPPTVREIASTTIGPLCPTRHTGDREFAGHGPRYFARVTLRVVDAATASKMKRAPGTNLYSSAIAANVYFSAREIGRGTTWARQSWDVVVAAAPPGIRYRRIVGPRTATFGEVGGVSSEGGFQFIIKRQPPASAWVSPDAGTAVDEFVVVGDTGGLDVSNDEDCTDDTSLTAILNPIRVEVSTIDTALDRVAVRLETGRDDVRGKTMSAFLRVDFAGGSSPEIDVTRLAKGRGTVAAIEIPLGRRVRVSDLRALRIRHVSNECFACTTDHWDVASIRVTTPAIGTILDVPAFRIGHTTKVIAMH